MVKNFLLAGTTVGAPLAAAGGTGDDAMTANTMAGQGLAATAIVADSAAASGRAVRINALAADTVRLYHAYTAARIAKIADYIKVNAAPTDNIETHYLIEATTFNQVYTIRLNAARQIELVNAAGAVAGTIATALVIGTWYRLEVVINQNASPTITNGSVTANLYVGNSTAVASSYTTTSGNAGTGTGYIRWQRFKMSVGSTFDVSFHSMRDEIGTDPTLLGPLLSTLTMAAVVTGSGTDTGTSRTLTMTASGGNGNAITFGPVDWGDGLTPDAAVTKAAGVSTATFTRTPSVAGAGKTGTAQYSQS